MAFNQKDSTFISYCKELQSISSICEDESGNIWIGTWLNGLFSFEIGSKIFTQYTNNSRDPESLSHYQVTSVNYERSGTMWIGTWGGGVNKLDKRRLLFSRYKHIEAKNESLYSNDIDCICQGINGEILLATEGWLEKFDPKTERFSRLFHNDYITQIVQDKDNCYWLGTSGSHGLYKYDGQNQFTRIYSVRDFPQHITSMCKNPDGIIWIGDGDGSLFSFNPTSEVMTRIELSINFGIKKIFEDKSGLIWIGTGGNGLICYDPVRKTTRQYKSESGKNESLSSNTIFAIHEDKMGKLWIGTSNGLDEFDRSKNMFNNFNEETGLLSNLVFTIFEDEHNNLWLSTAKGISKFNPGRKDFKNYPLPYRMNGIWFFQPPGFKANNGEIYLGGGNGLIRFHPDSIRENTFIPPIVITALHKFDKSFPVEKKIYLEHNDNFLSFEFAALSYINPDRNQYAYKMEGVDKDWVYSGTRRFASYPNLDPGEYTFRVKGSNSDGIWNEAGTSITIIISPPFWKTWWAYLSYAGIFFFALYGIRRYELNRISYKNQVKIDQAILNEKEETEKIKSRFFANISHEFRTPLTLILGPTEKIISKTSDDIIKDANIIKRNSRRLLQLINQLLDLSKLESGKLRLETAKGNIVSFIKGVALSFESLAESKDIILKLLPEKEFIEMYFDKEKMMQILTNILSNAFKFTPEEGTVTVSIKQSRSELVSASSTKLEISRSQLSGISLTAGQVQHDNTKEFVEIKIRDTGIGIAQEEIPKLFDRFYQVDSSHTREYEGTGIGLALTKELVELHQGSIRVESEKENAGSDIKGWTEFTLEFPLGKDHLKDEEIIKDDDKDFETREFATDEKYFTPKAADEKRSIILEESYGGGEEKTIILVVEDNYDMRQYIKESLDGNYLVEEAVNGEQGVRKAEKIIPDLIISDMMMPKMDGNELVRILKNDEKTSHIPIILLTAKAGQENKLEGLELGADDYLTKPFDIKELQVRIKNQISIRKRLQEKFSKIEFKSVKVEEKKLRSLDEKFMSKVNEAIEKHLSEEDFNAEELGVEVGMSRTQFYRKLKAVTGMPASIYLRTVRLTKAKKMIEEKHASISEIAYFTGFSSPSYFTKCFKEEFGYPPSDLIS